MSSTDETGGRPHPEVRPLRVTVVGNPGLDTLVLLDEDEIDLRADGHFVRNVDTVGHAPAFVARGLARLGHRVRLLGAVGDDPAGQAVADALAADGVDLSLVFRDPAGTPRSVNLVFPDGRRTFFYDGGSHMTLQPPDGLVAAALADTDLVVSSLPNWARHVLPRARAAGIPIAADLQDVRAVDDPYRAAFVACADLLFASAAHLPDPVAAAASWLAAGCATHVVLGRGARGALLVTPSTSVTPSAGAAPRAVAQPPPTLPPGAELPLRDTTGAGDSLAVGFLDGILALGLPPETALRRGQVLARVVSSELGGTARFDRRALDQLVSQVESGTATSAGG